MLMRNKKRNTRMSARATMTNPAAKTKPPTYDDTETPLRQMGSPYTGAAIAAHCN